MTMGTGLVLIAAGAILRYAVNDEVQSIDLETVGLILMIVGIVGLVISIAWMANAASRDRDGRGDVPPPPRPPTP